MLCFKFKNILILGDFNIHIDQNDCMLTKDFLFLLDCFNLKQLISGPTHNKGHTLDLVIVNDAIVSQLSSVDIGLSDHFQFFLTWKYLSPVLLHHILLISVNGNQSTYPILQTLSFPLLAVFN